MASELGLIGLLQAALRIRPVSFRLAAGSVVDKRCPVLAFAKSLCMRRLCAVERHIRGRVEACTPKKSFFKPAFELVRSRSNALSCVAVLELLFLTFIAPPALSQQSSRVPRVGILSPYTASASSFQDDIKRGLMDLGHLEGRTVEFKSVFADGRTDQLARLVTELMELKMDVIVTTTAPAVRAAKQATSTVPIVMGEVDDAVEQGFIASLARPGGNVTGTSWLNAELSGKRLDLLKQTIPGLSRVGVLREAVAGGASSRAVMTAARALGVQVYIWELRLPNELDDVFSDMARNGLDALSVLPGPMIATETSRIVQLAAQHHLLAIFPDRHFIEAGGLMSYGPSLPTMYRRAASYVDRILKGAKPSQLPVEQPTAFELVINLKSARAIGFDIPPMLLARADEVIE
jgi:putative tryptophan/tyrosine transport system substrate-binding protein